MAETQDTSETLEYEEEISPEVAAAIRAAAEAPLEPEPGEREPIVLSAEEAQRFYRNLMGELRHLDRNANGKIGDEDEGAR